MRTIKLFLTLFMYHVLICCYSQNWESLGGGIQNNFPRTLYCDSVDNYLYTSGNFYTLNDIHCKGAGRWNGAEWDSLGAGLDALDTLNNAPNNVTCIARYNGDLYFGGTFSSAGSYVAHSLARWNDTIWQPHPVPPFEVTPGISVNVLEVINSELYVGGNFYIVNGMGCYGVTKWNGTNWSGIGFPGGLDGYSVSSICEYQGEIYVGGNFDSGLPDDTLKDILRINTGNVRSVGGGLKGMLGGVSSMVVFQGELYVAGLFFESSGNTGENIQKWDGVQWAEVGGGMDYLGSISELMVHDNKLYAVGVFTTAGGIPASRIAYWDGNVWCSLGSSINNKVTSIAFYKDTLYIAGAFVTIDGDTIRKIAKWTGGDFVDQCGNNADVENQIENLNIGIYPNPTSQSITISVPQMQDQPHYSISNMLGDVVISGNILQGKTEIDLTGISGGIYFIILQYGDKSITRKIVKTN